MYLQQTDRVAIFIDGSNLYATVKSFNIDIDYKELYEFFKKQATVLRIGYYTAIKSQDFNPLKPLVDWLEYNGYSVKVKPTKDLIDSKGVKKIKGNMDIEMVIDMVELAPRIDQAILFTGDGDFKYAVEYMQRQGVRVVVVSTLNIVSDDLRRQADEFINLPDIAHNFAKVQKVTEEISEDKNDDEDDYEDDDDYEDEETEK